MRISVIVVAIALLIVAACNWFGVVWTFHPRRAIFFAVLAVLALIWLRFQRPSPG